MTFGWILSEPNKGQIDTTYLNSIQCVDFSLTFNGPNKITPYYCSKFDLIRWLLVDKPTNTMWNHWSKLDLVRWLLSDGRNNYLPYLISEEVVRLPKLDGQSDSPMHRFVQIERSICGHDLRLSTACRYYDESVVSLDLCEHQLNDSSFISRHEYALTFAAKSMKWCQLHQCYIIRNKINSKSTKRCQQCKVMNFRLLTRSTKSLERSQLH